MQSSPPLQVYAIYSVMEGEERERREAGNNRGGGGGQGGGAGIPHDPYI